MNRIEMIAKDLIGTAIQMNEDDGWGEDGVSAAALLESYVDDNRFEMTETEITQLRKLFGG